jgi:hypothetical protein
MAYAIYYHRDGYSPKLVYENLSEKEMWTRLEKMSRQAQQPVFFDGIVNEAKEQRCGYYYGERDKEVRS